MSKTNTIVRRIAGGSIALAAITAFAAPGIAAADTGSKGSGSLGAGSTKFLGGLGSSSGSSDSESGVSAPKVRPTVEDQTISVSVENPNNDRDAKDTNCGAMLFKADEVDTRNFDKALWPDGFNPETNIWTGESQIKYYTFSGLADGNYLVSALCGTPGSGGTWITPIKVKVGGETGSLDNVFGS
ncbi:hypothetical protein [Rhodococcus marinonascens]|uniref:hypothetical protein n=1 Tax=Rhodococcus marinonascens TaxID=38311 RepID=UPI000933E7C6|nr:hypothetical protein [Rhodococcus marinonascens]